MVGGLDLLVKYLTMGFKTSSGDIFVLRVNGVKDDVVAAMDYIVAKNPFVVKGGMIVKKVGTYCFKDKDNFIVIIWNVDTCADIWQLISRTRYIII
jgi:hypothetical protein